MVDENKIKKAVKMIIEAVGEDPEREGLLETPARMAKMYAEIFSGLREDAKKHLARTFECEGDNMVIEKDIQFYSMCEHHFLPFFGKVHIAYIPSERVVGLSKLGRTVDIFAKRPQLQERLTNQIAEELYVELGAKGVMVVVEAEHLCMSMRGVKKPGSITKTIAAKGIFNENKEIREEALALIKD